MDRIAPEGLALLNEEFSQDPAEENPQGILVRSSQVDTGLYPDLLAVARAGAGVNNITVEKATEQGICVFNTPGANANAVAELLFTMLGIWVRNIHQGIEFCKGLADLPDGKMSVRSCSSHIATTVVRQFNIEPHRMQFVEYYPQTFYGQEDRKVIPEMFEAVEFTWVEGMALHPKLKPLEPPLLDILKERLHKGNSQT